MDNLKKFCCSSRGHKADLKKFLSNTDEILSKFPTEVLTNLWYCQSQRLPQTTEAKVNNFVEIDKDILESLKNDEDFKTLAFDLQTKLSQQTLQVTYQLSVSRSQVSPQTTTETSAHTLIYYSQGMT